MFRKTLSLFSLLALVPLAVLPEVCQASPDKESFSITDTGLATANLIGPVENYPWLDNTHILVNAIPMNGPSPAHNVAPPRKLYIYDTQTERALILDVPLGSERVTKLDDHYFLAVRTFKSERNWTYFEFWLDGRVTVATHFPEWLKDDCMGMNLSETKKARAALCLEPGKGYLTPADDTPYPDAAWAKDGQVIKLTGVKLSAFTLSHYNYLSGKYVQSRGATVLNSELMEHMPKPEALASIIDQIDNYQAYPLSQGYALVTTKGYSQKLYLANNRGTLLVLSAPTFFQPKSMFLLNSVSPDGCRILLVTAKNPSDYTEKRPYKVLNTCEGRIQ